MAETRFDRAAFEQTPSDLESCHRCAGDGRVFADATRRELTECEECEGTGMLPSSNGGRDAALAEIDRLTARVAELDRAASAEAHHPRPRLTTLGRGGAILTGMIIGAQRRARENAMRECVAIVDDRIAMWSKRKDLTPHELVECLEISRRIRALAPEETLWAPRDGDEDEEGDTDE